MKTKKFYAALLSMTLVPNISMAVPASATDNSCAVCSMTQDGSGAIRVIRPILQFCFNNPNL